MVGHPVGACWQNQRTSSDDDTVVLADNANWATNYPAWASYTSDAYKRLRAVSCSSEAFDQIGSFRSGLWGEVTENGLK